MKARYLKHTKYEELKKNIEDSSHDLASIVSKYSRNDSFDDVIGNSDFNSTESFMIDESLFASLKVSDDKNERYLNDARNADKLYRSIKVSPTFATNHYFWSYLCHTFGKEYITKRWSPDNKWDISTKKASKKTISHIYTHFFVRGGEKRGLIRNGLSRLWWDGHLANILDMDDINSIEILKVINYRADIRASMLERPTSIINIELLKALVIVLKEYIDGDNCPERNVFRDMMKEINLIGGNELLAARSKEDHIKFIREFFDTS